MRTTRMWLGSAIIATVVLAAASVAWACTNQANIGLQTGAQSGSPSTSTSASGPAGSTVTVVGRDFGPGEVEVRWDSLSGREIGPRKQGPNFTVEVTIPADARPDVYYIVAVQYTDARTVNGQGRAAFEVTAPPSSSADEGDTPAEREGASGTQSSTSANGGSSGSTGESGSTSATSGAGESSGTDGASTGTGGSGQARTDTSSSGFPQRTASGGAGGNGQPAPPSSTVGATVNGGAAGAAGSAVGSGRDVFGPSVGPSESSIADAAGQGEGSPTRRTASGDLWSGFRSGEPSSLVSGLGATTSEPAGAPTSPLGLILGLFAAGLGAMMAGVGVAELRRRRSPVVAGRR